MALGNLRHPRTSVSSALGPWSLGWVGIGGLKRWHRAELRSQSGGHLIEDKSGQSHQTAHLWCPHITPSCSQIFLLHPRHSNLGGHQTPLTLSMCCHTLYTLLSWILFSPPPLPWPDESTAPWCLWPLPLSPWLLPLRSCYVHVQMGSPSLSGQGPLYAPKPPPHQAFALSFTIRTCSESLIAQPPRLCANPGPLHLEGSSFTSFPGLVGTICMAWPSLGSCSSGSPKPQEAAQSTLVSSLSGFLSRSPH